MIALSFAAFYGFLRPFVLDEADTFASVVQLILFLNYFCTIVIFTDSGLGSEMRSPFPPDAIGVFVLVINMVLGPFLAICSIFIEDLSLHLRLDSVCRIALKAGFYRGSVDEARAPVESDAEAPTDKLPLTLTTATSSPPSLQRVDVDNR